MKKIFYFAFACALALGGASCSDDSSSEVNEWSAIYVGIERPKLGVSTLTLNINHPTAEVEAKASVPVTVKLSRPATQDITATLAMESDCEEAWTFETLEVVIPAGQITATTTLNGDWSYATDVVSSQTWTTKNYRRGSNAFEHYPSLDESERADDCRKQGARRPEERLAGDPLGQRADQPLELDGNVQRR